MAERLVLGSYKKVQVSGTIGAALSAASLVYGFRWAPTPALICAVKSIRIAVATVATPFAAGLLSISVHPVRPYTTLDVTGGTAGVYTGNAAKLKSSFPATQGVTSAICTTAAISGGTGSAAETNAFATLVAPALPATATKLYIPLSDLYRIVHPEDLPLMLLKGEGFVIKATVPDTGDWALTVDVAWDELQGY